MGKAAESRLTQLHEGTPGLAWWRDRAVRRKPTSGASATGPMSRRATSAPSHRADEPPGPQAPEKTSSPCPHWIRGLFQTHHVNAVSRHRRVPPFASSRRPLTHALAHFQWREPPRFIDASATSRASTKAPSPSRGPTTRPLRASPRHP